MNQPAQTAVSPANTGAVAKVVAGAVALILVVWLALAAFAPGLLPSFLRLGVGSPEASPTTTSAAGSATAGSAQPGGSGGRISFVRSGDAGKTRDLYVVHADGTGQVQLTRGITIEGTTQWSPGGDRILAQAGVNGVSNVVLLDVGAGNAVGQPLSLTSDIGKDSAFPAWSPDGSKIAFQSKKDSEHFQVYVMDADGNNKHRLSDGKGFAGLPDWSPDGTRVAYVSGEQQTAGSRRELYIVPLSGGEPRKLTTIGSSLSNPKWSPDGKTIAVLEAVSDRQYNLLLVDAETGGRRSLVKGGIVRDQHYSPSGQEIAYYNVTAEDGSNVYVVKVSDGSTRSLTNGPGDDYQASWSPDGSLLAWSSKPGSGQYKIVVAPADGSATRTVSSGDGDDYQPAWAPRD